MKFEVGVALITAMLVTALVSLVALDLATRQQLDIRRVGNLLNYDQALLYNQGMEDWAAQILARDAAMGEVDHLGEAWAMQLPPLPVDGGELAGELLDQQGLYNLNNLINGAIINVNEIERFRRLLMVLELPPELAEALADWLDPDQERRFPGGAEDQEYLLAQPPYRAANNLLHSVSELRLVKGFSSDAYRRIAPFVTALPDPTPINVNTAPLPVILALVPDLRITDAEALIEGRGAQGYRDIQTFISQPSLAGRTANLSQGTGISVKSNWFLAHGRATIGYLSVEFYSLLFRDKGRVMSVRHSQGIL
ncbi:Type II secretion system protein K [Gammaproteobacteria bacterium]